MKKPGNILRYAFLLASVMLTALFLAPAKEVGAEERKVQSISFERAEPYIVWMGYDGHFDENGHSYCNSYNTSLLHGDALTVNTESESKVYAFDMEKDCFVAEDGETISREDVDVNMRDYFNRWTLNGDENYYVVSYADASCQVPIEMKESPVASIEYHPLNRYDEYFNGAYSPLVNQDEVIVHYKDGSTEVFLYDGDRPYPYEPAYHVTDSWYLWMGSFVSQTDGHLVPADHPYKLFESMRVSFDSDTRTYTMEYMGAKDCADDNTFVISSITYEQTAPAVYNQRNDAYTVTRDDGTTYEAYNLQNRFAAGDTLHVTYETIHHTEKTFDFVCDDSNTFRPEEAGPYAFSGDSDICIAFPDQSEEPLQPNSTYEFPVYMKLNDGYGDYYQLYSDTGYQVSIIGKSETTIENTRSASPDFATFLQILADAGFTDRYVDLQEYYDGRIQDIIHLATAYYYYDKEPGYSVTLDAEDFVDAVTAMGYYFSVYNLENTDIYDAATGIVTLTVAPAADPQIFFRPTEYAYTGGGLMIVERIDRSGNNQGMAVLSYAQKTYRGEFGLYSIEPYEDAEYEVRPSYYLPYQYDYERKTGFPKVIYENAWLFMDFDCFKNGEKITPKMIYEPLRIAFDPSDVVNLSSDGMGYNGITMRGSKVGTVKGNASFWFAYTKDMIKDGPEDHPTYRMDEFEIEVRPQTMKLDQDRLILAVGESETIGVSGLEEENDSLMDSSFNVGYRGVSSVVSIDQTGKVTGIAPGREWYVTVVSEKGQVQSIPHGTYVYDVQLSESEFTADGTKKEPTVTAITGYYENEVIQNLHEYSSDDWTVVSYENNLHAGTATAVIELRNTGIDDVITIRKSFTINPGSSVPVTGISMNKTSLTLGMGLSETLKATVLPEDASDKSVVWTSSDPSIAAVDANGKVTAGTKIGKTTITAAAEDGGYKASCEVSVKFRDVMVTGKYYYKPVYWAAANGITNGYTKTTDPLFGNFGVGANCTREDLVTFLWRVEGKPEPKTTKSPFSDIANGKYYTKAVLWAAEKGITKGYSDGTFGYKKNVTREDTVTFLYRAAGKPTVTAAMKEAANFKDVKAGKYYANPIAWAAYKGITKGYSSGAYAGKFGVGLDVTREDIVTFLWRYKGKPTVND